MTKALTLSKEEQAALQQEHDKHRQLLRRRLIGTSVVVAVAVLLWHKGDVPPPPQEVLQEAPALVPDYNLPGQQFSGVVTVDSDINGGDSDGSGDSGNDSALFDKLSQIIADTKQEFMTLALEEDALAEDEAEEGVEIAVPLKQESPALQEEVVLPDEVQPALATALESEALTENEETQSDAATPEAVAATTETTETIETTEATETQAEKTAAVAETKPEPKSKPKSKPAPPLSAYAVQVGAFSQLSRAESVADKLNQQKFTVNIKSLKRDDKKLWRVRVINYNTAAAAKEGQQLLAAIGYKDTQVVVEKGAKNKGTEKKVAKETAAKKKIAKEKTEEKIAEEKATKEKTTKEKTAAPAKPGAYKLRIGTFAKRESVEAVMAVADAQGLDIQLETLVVNGARSIIVSAVGFPSRAAAESMQKTLEQALSMRAGEIKIQKAQ